MSTTETSLASSSDLQPRPEHRFTFGLWTVGNPGRDPFGGPTREPVDPVDSVYRLGELGAWGVSLHDDDLVPWSNNQYLDDLLPNSEIHPLDAGHFAWEQAAEEYGRLVLDWVSGGFDASERASYCRCS